MKTSLLVMFLMVPTCLAMPYVASADLIFDSAKVHRAAASQHADVRRHISTTRTPSDSRLDASAAGTLNRKDRKNGAQTASRNAAETGVEDESADATYGMARHVGTMRNMTRREVFTSASNEKRAVF